MTTPQATAWDQRHRSHALELPAPAAVLAENAHLLPSYGTALDLACGLGGNALFLARRGLAVTARDLSAVAIGQLRRRADVEDLDLNAEVVDIEQQPFAPDTFDVIAVTRYLHRPLAPAIIASLNPGGLLFYQTYTATKPDGIGPTHPDYLLQENELLRLFGALQLRYYREDARCGDPASGRRNEAYFVGQKPRSPLRSDL